MLYKYTIYKQVYKPLYFNDAVWQCRGSDKQPSPALLLPLSFKLQSTYGRRLTADGFEAKVLLEMVFSFEVTISAARQRTASEFGFILRLILRPLTTSCLLYIRSLRL